MGEKKFKLHYATTELVDPMGSIIVNTTTTSSPNYQWAYVSNIKAVGPVDPLSEITAYISGYRDTTSYKIRIFENLPKHNNPSAYIGSSACLTSPDALGCNGLGPYMLFGKRYYIDFIVLYFVNRSVVPDGDSEVNYYISSPIFSVDTSRCSPDYGIFLAVPKPQTPGVLEPYMLATSGSTIRNMFTSLPEYTNEIGKFNLSVKYRLTALNSQNEDDFMDDFILTPGTIVQALNNVITYGQTSIVSVKEDNTPLVLMPQSNLSSSDFHPQSYLPFIVFRYISVDAPTRRVNLSISFAPNV